MRVDVRIPLADNEILAPDAVVSIRRGTPVKFQGVTIGYAVAARASRDRTAIVARIEVADGIILGEMFLARPGE